MHKLGNCMVRGEGTLCMNIRYSEMYLSRAEILHSTFQIYSTHLDMNIGDTRRVFVKDWDFSRESWSKPVTLLLCYLQCISPGLSTGVRQVPEHKFDDISTAGLNGF